LKEIPAKQCHGTTCFTAIAQPQQWLEKLRRLPKPERFFRHAPKTQIHAGGQFQRGEHEQERKRLEDTSSSFDLPMAGG
jgi:hypothetical protein